MDTNPIYKFMKENRLTQKDEATFISEYSNPQKSAELHKFMTDNRLTTKGADDFYNEYFNPSKKKGGTTQGSGQPVQQPAKPSAPSFGQKVVSETLTQEVQVPLRGQQKAPVQKKPYQDITYKREQLPSETTQMPETPLVKAAKKDFKENQIKPQVQIKSTPEELEAIEKKTEKADKVGLVLNEYQSNADMFEDLDRLKNNDVDKFYRNLKDARPDLYEKYSGRTIDEGRNIESDIKESQRDREVVYNNFLSDLQTKRNNNDRSVQKAGQVTDELISSMVTGDNYAKYTTSRGDFFDSPVVDMDKVNDEAVAIAEKYNLPTDGESWRLLKNKIKGNVDYQIVSPEAKKVFNEKYAGLANERQELFEAGFTDDNEILAKAESQLNTLESQYQLDAKNELAIAEGQYRTKSNQLNQEYKQFNDQLEAQQAELNRRYQSKEIDKVTYEDQFNKIEQSKQDYYQQYKSNFPSPDQYLKISNEINSKYNRKFELQRQAIASKTDADLKSAYDKYSKTYKENPELLFKINEAYKDAYSIASQTRTAKMATPRYTPYVTNPLSNFYASTLSSMGGVFKGWGGSIDSKTLELFGESMEQNFMMPAARSEEFKDWVDPQNAQLLFGQLAGSMLPSMAITAAVATATGGQGIPAIVPMVAGGLAGWTSETVDIVGRSYLDMFERSGGDVARANKAAESSLKSQYDIMFTYAFDALPFVGKVLRGVPTKVGRVAAGGAIEMLTEFAQEYPQNIAEENIQKGLDPWTNLGEALQDGKKMKQTLISIGPVAIMGGAGQLKSKSARQESVDAYVAMQQKEALQSSLPDQKRQYIQNMVFDQGGKFARGVVGALYANGTIDEQGSQDLLVELERSEKIKEAGKSAGLKGSKLNVYGFYSARAEEAERNAAKFGNDPILFESYKQQAKQYRDAGIDFMKGNNPDLLTVTYADGSQAFMAPEDVNGLFSNTVALTLLSKNKISVEAYRENGEGGKALQELRDRAENYKRTKKYTAAPVRQPEVRDSSQAPLEQEEGQEQDTRDVEIEKIQQQREALGVNEVDMFFSDMKPFVATMVEQMEASQPSPESEVSDASDYLYAKYKELTAMKSDPNRMMTIAQIESIQAQLEQDLQTLEGNPPSQKTEVAPTSGVLQAQEEVAPEVTTKEVKANMKPITDEMAKVEMEFDNNGFSIDWDYDNEIIITNKKTGEIVDAEELPESLLPLAAQYEKATSGLADYDFNAYQESLKQSRSDVGGIETEFEEVKPAALPEKTEPAKLSRKERIAGLFKGEEKPTEEPVEKSAKAPVKPFSSIKNLFRKGFGSKRVSERESISLTKELNTLIDRAEKENGFQRDSVNNSTWKTNDGYTITEFFENKRGGTRITTPEGEEINIYDNKYKNELGKEISYFPEAGKPVEETKPAATQERSTRKGKIANLFDQEESPKTVVQAPKVEPEEKSDSAQLTLKDGRKISPTKINGQTTFFHASPKKREGRLKANTAPQWGNAVYFAGNRKGATDEFGRDNVTEASLDLKKPLYTNSKEFQTVRDKATELYNKAMLPKILQREAEFVNGKWKFFNEDFQSQYDNKGYVDFYSSSDIEEGKYFGQAAKELGYDAIIDEGGQYGTEIAVLDENAVIYPEDVEASLKAPKEVSDESVDQVEAKKAIGQSVNELINKKNRYNKIPKRRKVIGTNLLNQIKQEAENLGFNIVNVKGGNISLTSKENGKVVARRDVDRKFNEERNNKLKEAKSMAGDSLFGLRGSVLLYFLGGGKVMTSQSELAGKSEIAAAKKVGFISDNGRSVDMIALEDLQDLGGVVFDEQDAINEILDVLASFENKTQMEDELVEMVDKLNRDMNDAMKYRSISEMNETLDKNELDENQLREYYEALSEDEKVKSIEDYEKFYQEIERGQPNREGKGAYGVDTSAEQEAGVEEPKSAEKFVKTPKSKITYGPNEGLTRTDTAAGPIVSESGNAPYSERGGVRGEGLRTGGVGNTVKAVWNKYKQIKFNGSVKVKDAEDVAHIMRKLEDKSVEHAFAVHVDKDGNSHIQFLGMGGPTSTIVDPRLILAGVNKFKSKKVYLVHNHPSGTLVASRPDVVLTNRVDSFLSPLGIELEHVIMDTYKKEYVHLYPDDLSFVKKRDISKETIADYNKALKAEMMDEQKILSEPVKAIRSSMDASEFLMQLRFTALPKHGMLLLNNKNEIIGNYIFKKGFDYKETVSFVADSGIGTGIIFYSNQDQFESGVKPMIKSLEAADVKVFDYVIMNSESEGVRGYYQSYADENKLSETQAEYGTKSIPNELREPTPRTNAEAQGTQGQTQPVTEAPVAKPGRRERLAKMFETSDGEEAVPLIEQALSEGGIKVEVKDDADYNEDERIKGSQGRGSEGMFIADDGTIVLNRDKIKGEWGKTIVFHEGIHPVINIIRNTDPKRYKAIVDGLKAEGARNKEVGKVAADVASSKVYQERGAETIEDETLVETMARVATGDVDIDTFDPTFREKFIEFMNDIAKMLGLRPILTNSPRVEVKRLADQINNMLNDGGKLSDIVGKKNVGKFQNTLKTGSQERAVSIAKGKESLIKYGLKKGANTTRKIGEALEKRSRELYGIISREDRSEKALKAISSFMADEVRFFVEEFGENSGKGWYGEKFQKGLDAMAAVFPEMKDDQNARDLFTMLVAITSDGTEVMQNFQQASLAYKNYKETGKMPTAAKAQRAESYLVNFNNIQALLDKYDGDIQAIKKELLTIGSISELNKQRKTQGLEKLDTKWPASFKVPLASSIFGPKLGMFYANLSGMEQYPTLDRWWSRTFNRYRGTLIPQITKGYNKKGEALGIDRYREIAGLKDASEEEVLAKIVQDHDTYEDKGYKKGTPAEKAANTLYKKLYVELNDAPFGAKDRQFMYDAFIETQKKLKRSGINVTIADVQAILWYFEKNLYKKLGVTKPIQGISYEDAANKTYEKWKNSGNSFNYAIKDSEQGETIDEVDIDEESAPKGQPSAINRTPSELRALMEDSLDAVEKDVADGVDAKTAVENNVTSQDWYGELTPNQKQNFNEIITDEFGVTPEAPVAKPTGIKATIANIIDNYYKGDRQSKLDNKQILDSDPKLKYIYDNIAKINKQLQDAGVITDKTDGCP